MNDPYNMHASYSLHDHTMMSTAAHLPPEEVPFLNRSEPSRIVSEVCSRRFHTP
jgi:hypothetical protein